MRLHSSSASCPFCFLNFALFFSALLVFSASAFAAPPNLVSPEDSSTWTFGFLVNFTYNVSDTVPVDNCTLFIDGFEEALDKNVSLDAEEWMLGLASNGQHSWYITCTDSNGQNETSSSQRFNVSYSSSESLTLHNLGQAGFEQTNPEYTSLRTVIAETSYSSSAVSCSYRNQGESAWTSFEDCVSQRYWLLTDSNGLKLVWVRINHSDSMITYAYDTIYLQKLGYGLDVTPPGAPVIYDDGDFTNDNSSLHFRWDPGYDRESELLHIPLEHYFRINGTNYSSWHNVTYLTEITIPVSLTEYQNYTIEMKVVNSGNLTNYSSSDGIVVDLTPPSIVAGVSSSYSGGWTSNNTVSFNWSGTFSDGSQGSGVGAYSFTLSSSNSTIPDSVPEGTPGHLSEKTGHTFTGLSSGVYYFHLSARDNAGNWGSGASIYHSSPIYIDITPPSIPQMTSASQNSSAGTVTFNWSAASDAHSGVKGYFLQVAPDRSFSSDVKNFTLGNVTSHTLAVPYDGTWYGRVKAFDMVGNYGFFSDLYGREIDVTPPRFLFAKPNGTIVASPVLVVETDEQAVCTYDGLPFSFTNSTHHETRPSLSQGSHSITVSCTDMSGNTNSTSLDFFYNSSYLVTFVLIHMPSSTFTSRLTKISVEVFSGGVPLGEISKSRFSLSVGSMKPDFSLSDRGNGIYWLTFEAPSDSGSYLVNVSVDSVSGLDYLNVSAMSLKVSYSYPGITPETSSFITLSPFSGVFFGLATDSPVHSFSSQLGTLSLKVPPQNGSSYVFITSKRPANSKEELLKSARFFNLVNPSFGFPISDRHTIRAALAYDDIVIQTSRSRKIPPGKYNIVLRNEGLDDNDKTKVSLSLL